MIPLLTTSSVVTCPHGGQAILSVTRNKDAKIDGDYALLLTDEHPIVGCPFTPVAPSPCVTIRWLTGTTMMSLHGTPFLLATSVGLCLNAAQAPQGPALVVSTQQRAMGV
jgi:hypothetical protein